MCKKSRLSRARREDAGGGAGRRLPVQLDAALGEECLGGLACFCMGARGALPEAHAVLLIAHGPAEQALRSEEHTSELQSLMRISYDVFCLKKKQNKKHTIQYTSSLDN